MTALLESGSLAADCAVTAGWPLPGSGATLQRWQQLAATSELDVVRGRLQEAHSDADAILAELIGERAAPGTRYGVWAANAPGHTLSLQAGRVYGTKAWCSGATLLTHALVTVGQDLVEVALDQPAIRPGAHTWPAAGMRRADTRIVAFDGAEGRVLGSGYLSRPGFWIGAIGVAAVWYGGTQPLLDPLRSREDPHSRAHLGACIARLVAARAALREAAEDSDRGQVDVVRALAVRATVSDTVTEVARRLGRALGPLPYATDPVHTQRLADLEVYVRQDHAERDLEVLGRDSSQQSWSL